MCSRPIKRIEKLDYIHTNPVKRGLVASPEDWRWSSCRHYQTGHQGRVRGRRLHGEINGSRPKEGRVTEREVHRLHPSDPSSENRSSRILAATAGYLVVLLTSLWAVMALAIDLPFPRLRILAAVLYGLAILVLFLLIDKYTRCGGCSRAWFAS